MGGGLSPTGNEAGAGLTRPRPSVFEANKKTWTVVLALTAAGVVDLSAGMHKGGLGAIPSDVSGFGVAFTLELLAARDPAELAKSWS